MADDTGTEVVIDVEGVEDVLETPEVSKTASAHATAASSSIESSTPQGAGGDVKAEASAPASIGKRAINCDVADEDGESQQGEALPPRKKARKDSAVTASSLEDSPSSPDVPSQPAAPGIAVSGLRTSFAQPTAASSGGVRTSFGSSSQKPITKANVDFVMHNPLTTDERKQFMASIRDYESVDVKPLNKRKLDWTISHIKPDFLVGNTWLETWESIIDKWCEAFLLDNQANIDQVGLAPSLLKTAFQRRLDVEAGEKLPSTFRQINRILLRNPDTSRLRKFAGAFKPDQEKLAKRQARTAAKSASATSDALHLSPETDQQTGGQFKSSSTPLNPADSSTNSPPPTSTQTDDHQGGEPTIEHQQSEVDMEDGEINSGDASSVDMAIDEDEPPISQAELDQRQRYFPNIPDNVAFCLTCAQLRHATANCPELTCKFCHGAHFKYECATRQRCAKCKQLGHTKSSCPEKLAVAPGEVTIECAICEGRDHTEINCIQLYQIYRPQPGKVNKVKSLPIFCYACGTEGHYGGDCPLADPSVPPTKLWTMSTACLYVDPSVEDLALSYRNELPPPPEVNRPIIPGRSIKPQTHVIFEESDGEGDGDSIPLGNGGPSHRNTRAKKPNKGPAIQIASNISFGGNSGTGPSHHQQQPPQPQPPKKAKGPAHPPKRSKKPGNEALPSTKPAGGGRRNKNKGPPPPPPPPPRQSQGSGGRGGGNAGRGGGGFSQLANKRPRRTRH